MKNLISFIIKTIIYLITFTFIVSVTFLICTIIFSHKNNISVEDTLTHFESIGREIITPNSKDKDSLNIISATDDNNTSDYAITTSSSNVQKYYYYQLDTIAKTIYDELENNIDNLKKENYVINFNTQFNDLLHDSLGQYKLNKAFQSALDSFFYDHPEVFYIDLTKISLIITSTSLGPHITYTVKLEPKDGQNYLLDTFSSEKDVIKAISKVENIKNNLINQLTSDNDYNKVLKIHNTLINSIEYDSDSNKNTSHNIYGTLVNKKAVCEGYAKAFKYLLDSLNIESILVSGTGTNSSGDSESHMWNYVKLNENWYGVDVTWDDPVIIGGTSKNNIRYDFFLKGKSTFLKSHSASGKISDIGILFKLPSLSTKNYK